MIVRDKEHYIYEKRDKIRENIILILLINAIHNLIANYKNLKNEIFPVELDTIYSIVIIVLSIQIIKTANDIKNYAKRHNLDIKKNKYIKTYDKLLLYIFLTISIGRIMILLYKKNFSANNLIRLFFNIFFIFVILYYFNFLF
jgi:hypothetical protein